MTPWLMGTASLFFFFFFLQHVVHAAEFPFVISIFRAHFDVHSSGKRGAVTVEIRFFYIDRSPTIRFCHEGILKNFFVRWQNDN